MKIIVFGLGDIYNKVKHYFYQEKTEIVALIDNNRILFGTLIDGYKVDDPKHIQNYQYDYIVVTSNYAVEMKRQLIEFGVFPDKIIHYGDFLGRFPITVEESLSGVRCSGVLILSNGLGYHGGSMTCMTLARILSQNGYKITLAIPSADQKFLDEISSEESIKVIIIENLEFLSEENLEWTNGYTYILANTFEMVRCAVKLARKRKVYLWLHESMDTYIAYEYWHEEIANGLENDKLIIGAVSDVAKSNFLSKYLKKKKVELLPYGINDRYLEKDFRIGKRIITFTIVALHIPLKGLDVLFDALQQIPTEAGNQCRFLFVGKTFDNDYGKSIINHIDKNTNCKYLGELSREEVFDVYSETDILIIPSRRDSLPLVATEGMMLKKPCIISDTVGTARYIKHKYNGLIFENENSRELAGVICWCLKNIEALQVISDNARKTYETWFTMEKFEARTMDVIRELS